MFSLASYIPANMINQRFETSISCTYRTVLTPKAGGDPTEHGQPPNPQQHQTNGLDADV